MSIITVGLKLGASLDNAFSSVFSSANSTVNRLGRTTDALKQKQNALGQALSRSFNYPIRSVNALRTQYDKLGQSIERIKSKQQSYNAALAKQKSLTEQRQALMGDMVSTVGAAWANAKFLRTSIGSATQYQDTIRDARVGSSISAEDEAKISQLLLQTVGKVNQDPTALAKGVGAFIKNNMGVEEITSYVDLLGKSATGLRLSMEDSSATFLALRDMGVDSEEKMQQALDHLVWAGNSAQGGYSLQNMFKSIGELNDEIKSNKLGLDSLGDIAATLQIGDGTMGSENTMAALKGWLGDMKSDRRAQQYTSAYKSIDPNAEFDYAKSMSNLVSSGFSEFEASLNIAGKFLQERLGSKGMQEMLGANGDDEKQRSMIEQFGLSELFKDKNQIQMVLGYINQKEEYNRIKQGNSAQGALQNTFDLRMESPTEQFNRFGHSLKTLSVTIGNALLPPVLALVRVLNPVVNTITKFVSAHPNITAGVIGIATAITALKVATLGATWGMNFFVKTPLTNLKVLLAKTGLNLELFNAKMLLTSTTSKGMGGVFTQVASGISFIGKTMATVGRAMLLNPIGLVITSIAIAALLIFKYWEPISAFFTGVFEGISEALSPIGEIFSSMFSPLGEVLSPIIDGLSAVWNWFTSLFEPVHSTAEELESATNIGRSFGQILGKAIRLILTPAELLFKAIGWLGSAIQSVFNWSPMETISQVWSGVTGWFDGIWASIISAFDGGIKGIGRLILEWSPLNLFSQAFSKVLSWFGLELPASFTEAGENIIDGLIDGVTSKITAVKDTIFNIGSSVGDWFKDKLGIHSPSRVFMGFGENISEGAAIGIENQTGSVSKAMQGLAAATAISLSSPVFAQDNTQHIAPPTAQQISAKQQMEKNASMVIHFSPQIVIKGNDEIQSQVNEAMQFSFREFEKLMKQYEHRQNRLAYRGIDS